MVLVADHSVYLSGTQEADPDRGPESCLNRVAYYNKLNLDADQCLKQDTILIYIYAKQVSKLCTAVHIKKTEHNEHCNCK